MPLGHDYFLRIHFRPMVFNDAIPQKMDYLFYLFIYFEMDQPVL